MNKVKVSLGKVRLNNGGYDRSGKYWGLSDVPLYTYQYELHGNVIDDHLRAADREVAKERIKRKLELYFPEAKIIFYR